RVEPLGVPRHAVELGVLRLVGAAEAEVVGHDRAVPGLDERPYEVAVEVPPGWVAVHHHDGTAIARALVDVVHASVGRVDPLRLAGPGAVEGPVRYRGHVLTLPKVMSYEHRAEVMITPSALGL